MRLTRRHVSAGVAAVAACCLVTPAQAIGAITRNGKYLYTSSGSRFYIKGLAYQEAAPLAPSSAANNANGGFPEPDTFYDPLADSASCERDIANFQDLGINTIRVYSVNASLDHDACMNALSSKGIYVILDLALPANGSINRAEPTWDVGLLDAYLGTVDTFLKYDNLLAFGIANEVVNQRSNANAAPFVKAAARDVKAYLKSKDKSNVLVTYSAVDGASGEEGLRDQLANYLTCGSADESIDLYGLNSYAWCGNSSYTTSGYDALTSEYAQLPVPSYLSEFGCVPSGGADTRPWTEVSALFSAPMTDTWSGGIAFSYFPQPSGTKNYGLTTVSGSEVTLQPDWNSLKAQYANATPPAMAPSGNAPSYAQCADDSNNFAASSTLPPTPDADLCDCARSNAWACTLKPSANMPSVIGTLTGYACSYLGENGGSCDPINANGTSGVYGNFAACRAEDRLNWAMSQFYEQDRAATSCDFGGNATLRASTASSFAANAAESSCVSQNPLGVQVPSSPSGASTSDSGSSSGSGSGSGSSQSTSGSGNDNGSPAPLQLSGSLALALFIVSLSAGVFALV